MKLLLTFILCSFLSCASCANILFLTVFPGKSHWLMFEHVIKALLNKGHHVTAITNYKLSSNSSHYTEVLIDPPWDFDANLDMKHFFYKKPYESVFFKIKSLGYFGTATQAHAFQAENVKNFIKNNNEKFDLIISEHFMQDGMNLFVHKYKAPFLYISTLDYDDVIDQTMGALSVWSHLPHYLSDFNEEMNFQERFLNAVYSIFGVIYRRFVFLPGQWELANNAMKPIEANVGPLPPLHEFEKNVSLVLVNSHIAINFKRPKMPGHIDVAGLQIRPTKPLPKDIKKFLDETTDGAIYFSFGSYMRSSEMPQDKLELILKVFSKLKMRVLWKFEVDSTNFPANVLVRKWLPQNDILAHKNLKLFIGHGGIYGIQEAIYHAVPLIVFPFFGDQHRNGAKLVRNGIGIMMGMAELTEESFLGSIKSITGNQTYYENINKLSEIFRDNPMEPLDSAVFWIEYVIKFKGANHLKSTAAINLNWYQYLMLDVLITMILILLAGIYVLLKILSAISRKLFSSGSSEIPNKKKKQN